MGIHEREPVRCLDCRCEYDLPEEGELVCPDCGSATWIAADIRDLDADLSPAPV